MSDGYDAWWNAEEGSVHERVMPYVAAVEKEQSDLFDRFVKLSALYDPNDRTWSRGSLSGNTVFGSRSHVIENVIATNVDTATAVIAAQGVRPKYLTDEADWSTQRRFRYLTWYSEALGKLLNIRKATARGIHDGALKGTGLVKVYIDKWDQIKVERVLVDDIVVDEGEVRAGSPKQLHQRLLVDREQLVAEYPDRSDEIEAAQASGGNVDWRYWADYRPINADQLVVIESYRLPIGVKGKEGYKPGRHTICVDGVDLVDEEWIRDRFPYARFVWKERDTGWYGIGLAERIAGHQRGINKLNWQTDRQLDQLALPTTWVQLADANIAVKTTNRLGTIGVYKSEIPKTVHPPAVSPEIYQRTQHLNESAYGETGMSRLTAQAKKPAGIESGAGLREYRDQTTERLSQQEKEAEEFELDIHWLCIEAARELGDKAPKINRKSKFGRRRLEWDDVDPKETKVNLTAASTLSRTSAGRTTFVMEMAQGGVISQDIARRLLKQDSTLDIDHEISLYVAALEDIERCIEEVEDGNNVVPEPYQNLKMGIWRFQQAYLKDRDDGAPESVLEGLRQWITQAAWIQSQAEAPEMAMPMDANTPMEPELAAQAAELPGAPGPEMLGSGVVPANLLQ